MEGPMEEPMDKPFTFSLEPCEASTLPAGSLVLRVHTFDTNGEPTPPEDWEVVHGYEDTDLLADELVRLMEESCAVGSRGELFRIDSEDQSTRLYRVSRWSWERCRS